MCSVCVYVAWGGCFAVDIAHMGRRAECIDINCARRRFPPKYSAHFAQHVNRARVSVNIFSSFSRPQVAYGMGYAICADAAPKSTRKVF